MPIAEAPTAIPASSSTAEPPAATSTSTSPPQPSATYTVEVPTASASPDFSHPELDPKLLQPGALTPYSFLTEDGVEIRYLLYLPPEFRLGSDFPLLVFLHGDGRTGRNIDRLIDGTPLEQADPASISQFIMIAPQLPSGFWSKLIEPMEELLNRVTELLAPDPDRFYLTGQSLGGSGAWQYALRYPDRFAALAPISGAAALTSSVPVPGNICDISDLPIWVAHGDADSVIPFKSREAVVAALRDCGADVTFMVFPGGEHPDAWIMTYSDPAFYEWLLGNSK